MMLGIESFREMFSGFDDCYTVIGGSACDILMTEAGYLIPFKMYAWLNHKDRKAAGLHVNDKDIKKHKNDAFRLLQIVTPDRRIETNGLVRDVIVRFLSEIEAEDIPFKQMGLPFTKDEALSYLRDIYI